MVNAFIDHFSFMVMLNAKNYKYPVSSCLHSVDHYTAVLAALNIATKFFSSQHHTDPSYLIFNFLHLLIITCTCFFFNFLLFLCKMLFCQTLPSCSVSMIDCCISLFFFLLDLPFDGLRVPHLILACLLTLLFAKCFGFVCLSLFNKTSTYTHVCL